MARRPTSTRRGDTRHDREIGNVAARKTLLCEHETSAFRHGHGATRHALERLATGAGECRDRGTVEAEVTDVVDEAIARLSRPQPVREGEFVDGMGSGKLHPHFILDPPPGTNSNDYAPFR